MGLTNDVIVAKQNKAVVEISVQDYLDDGNEKTNTSSKKISEKLKRIFEEIICREKHVRSKITIQFDILSSDSLPLPHLINLGSYALQTAGVSIIDTTMCCSCCLVENELILDPTNEERKGSELEVVLALMGVSEKVSYMKAEGKGGAENVQYQDVRLKMF